MTVKRLVLLPLADHDIEESIGYYQLQGGQALADRWAEALDAGLRHVTRYSGSGSQRYVDMLGLPGLRFWPIKRFPHLIFYVERAEQIDVWRVLHDHRDLPAWLRETSD